jgi:hypothetical protein
MFSSQTPADKLVAALVAYQADLDKKLQSQPNPDAEEAKKRVARADELVRQSGLGKALVTLVEHTKHWPAWSKREDFLNWTGFPVEEVIAKEHRDEERYKTTKTTIVCFVYCGLQYGIVFKDKGGTSLPDGDVFYSGTVEFVAASETVLGLNISQEHNEYTSEWRYSSVYALRIGEWTKALLEIAAHIHAHDRNSSARRRDEAVLAQAKNISI